MAFEWMSRVFGGGGGIQPARPGQAPGTAAPPVQVPGQAQAGKFDFLTSPDFLRGMAMFGNALSKAPVGYDAQGNPIQNPGAMAFGQLAETVTAGAQQKSALGTIMQPGATSPGTGAKPQPQPVEIDALGNVISPQTAVAPRMGGLAGVARPGASPLGGLAQPKPAAGNQSPFLDGDGSATLPSIGQVALPTFPNITTPADIAETTRIAGMLTEQRLSQQTTASNLATQTQERELAPRRVAVAERGAEVAERGITVDEAKQRFMEQYKPTEIGLQSREVAAREGAVGLRQKELKFNEKKLTTMMDAGRYQQIAGTPIFIDKIESEKQGHVVYGSPLENEDMAKLLADFIQEKGSTEALTAAKRTAVDRAIRIQFLPEAKAAARAKYPDAFGLELDRLLGVDLKTGIIDVGILAEWLTPERRKVMHQVQARAEVPVELRGEESTVAPTTTALPQTREEVERAVRATHEIPPYEEEDIQRLIELLAKQYGVTK